MTKELEKIRDSLPHNFCPIPFSNLIFNPDGNVAVCRMLPREFMVGSIEDSTVTEIWNSEKIRNWRKEFLTGNVVICADKIRDKRCHLENEDLLPYITLSEQQPDILLRITANLNGECNLECPMCTVWKMPNGKYSQIIRDEGFKKNLYNVKQMDFYAGEPLIQEDTFTLIDMIWDKNPTCEWRFTSNANWIYNKKMEDYFRKIKISSLHFSLDSFRAETYAKIRRNGDLNLALKTIAQCVRYNHEHCTEKPIFICVSTTVQKDNWNEVPEFIEKTETLGAVPLVQYLHGPSNLSLNKFNENEKNRMIEYYFNQLSDGALFACNELMKTLINQLSVTQRKKNILRYLNCCERFLKSRKNG